MAKSLTFILVALMALALLIFTASRTLDLLQLLLPVNQSVFAYLGLVAFDGGLLGWSLWFAYGARGQYQRAIALLMVVLSLVAIGLSTIADLMLSASAKGLVDALSEQQRLAILLAVGGIVFLNVAAFFFTHITDPERLRAMATENAKDQIHAETLRQIGQVAPIVAAQVAPQLTADWVRQTVQALIPTAQPALPTPPPPAQTVDADPPPQATPAPTPTRAPASAPAAPPPPAPARVLAVSTGSGFKRFNPFTWFGAKPQAPAPAPTPAPPPEPETAKLLEGLAQKLERLQARMEHWESTQRVTPVAPLVLPESVSLEQLNGTGGASNGKSF
jgi:hypothetical protein